MVKTCTYGCAAKKFWIWVQVEWRWAADSAALLVDISVTERDRRLPVSEQSRGRSRNIDLLAGVRCSRRGSRQPCSPACRSSPRTCSCSPRRPAATVAAYPKPKPNAYRAVSPCIGTGALPDWVGSDLTRPDPTRSLLKPLSSRSFLPSSNSRFSPTPMDSTPPPPIRREAWEGCSVLLDINDGDRLAFFRLTPGASVLPSLPQSVSLTSLLPSPLEPTLCVRAGR